MALDQTNVQLDIAHDPAADGNGWNTEATKELISFSGGCPSDVPVPTCVVTTDTTCTSSPTAYDTNKIKCTINSNPAYQSTDI
jgi:hypothetical protein